MTKARTFYGVTAKETLTLVQASTKPVELGERLAFVDKRIGDFRAKGQLAKVSKWTKVREAIIARINALTVPAAPQPVVAAATFVDAPLPKAAKGRKGKSKGKAVGFDLDGLSDAQVDAMFRQLAGRIAARA